MLVEPEPLKIDEQGENSSPSILLTDKYDNILIGLAKLPPELIINWDNDVEGYEHHRRSSVILVNETHSRFTFFKHKNQKMWDLEKKDLRITYNKIIQICVLLKTFKICIGQPFYVSLDQPNRVITEESIQSSGYHTDNLSFLFIIDEQMQKIIRLGITTTGRGDLDYQVDYAILEYSDLCVSTTINIYEYAENVSELYEDAGEKYEDTGDEDDGKMYEPQQIRFMACPGNVLCIQNTTATHSVPYIIEQTENEYPPRLAGNEQIYNSVGINRNLYRTGIKHISQEKYNQTMFILNNQINFDKYMTINLTDIDPNIDKYIVYLSRKIYIGDRYNLIDYIKHVPRHAYEAGGRRKQHFKKTHRRKTHRRKTHRRKTHKKKHIKKNLGENTHKKKPRRKYT